MADWRNLAGVNEVEPGQMMRADLDDTPIILVNLEGVIYALEDLCSHDGGTLSDGELNGETIECPRHGARFDVRTGALRAPPAVEGIHVFPVRVENGRLWVRDDRWD
jgi:3-phenylpropionate/trans-cinnamate dioxygenase ferredoxin subunit